jgi:hypothetical protein
MGGIERQSGAALGAGAARGQRGATRQLAEFAADLADVVGGDRHLVIEAVATHYLDAALEHQPGWGGSLADVEYALARREGPRLPAGKSFGRLDLRDIEHGEHLIPTGLDQAHCVSPVGRSETA